MEDVLEEVCTVVIKEECKNKTETTEVKEIVKSCNDIVKEVCINSTVTEEIEKCETMVEQVCEPCQPVFDEKCEEAYETEYREECSYNTIIDRKCARSYAVTYRDECRAVTESECKFLGNFLCENIEKVKCKKVPNFPFPKCQNVSRLEKHCKAVPVQRPYMKCHTIQRQGCENNVCMEVSTIVCEKVPTEIVSETCNYVTENVCKDEIVKKPVEHVTRVCNKIPEKICKQNKVKRQKLVPKRICKELKLIDREEN